ncbi:MinD-like ATPase involved in chromosome partitioning or flagellar assembly/tetratricopeptide (TPR) repeat protein [Allocatelliglobosispora scoriae]|uniref:MinD-like ATPase involved in chromosome partitioning or flagellar assembly/tetratricopeptide (TPR) repeat protein n=1 Tax=Allocatelliglobosispora scoriae TaxID=643052 RepID=A0A841BQS5_9ACTN|nr:FxSxx-COOH system tetratricopeptide repeat protein [Allocatelliglobosispora scoriae]MBB5869102.1 MinD-like ATPase involved in chromosome partitioning or flagellar assembly/tetratricopeptide (TPR) repeat protein [Allocatelliglobosispora scoriae]
MTANRNGQVVTFYSYKGGTGRTMALANVAWILAANGKRVLVVDWDLESPGLNRFFSPFIKPNALASTGGVIELIRGYEWATIEPRPDARWIERYASVQKYSFSLDWKGFPEGGTLDYLSAGRENNDYNSTVAATNWDDFYERLGGGQFFDALRADMKRHYDYTLIDSRTGFSDVADICTIHLPDTLVDCFTLSEQGIDGSARMARTVRGRYAVRNIRILPVPMRVDPAEKEKADAGRSVAMRRFEGLPTGLSDVERQAYWNAVQIPYQAFYGYEETLATFADQPGGTGTLLSAYETLTHHITGGEVRALPPMEEAVRSRVAARFIRRPSVAEDEVVLRFAPQDQVWAEWVAHVLTTGGLRVHAPSLSGTAEEAPAVPPTARTTTIVSHVNAASEAAFISAESNTSRLPLAIYVSDVPRLTHIPLANGVQIAGQPGPAAVERILGLVGRSGIEPDTVLVGAPRYPGDDNRIFNVPQRNSRFTGREEDLRRLRGHLRERSAVVLSGAQPVALQGMGGIGKTQLAIEYAYRFRAAYDVICWVSADPVGEIETSLIDLGAQLGVPMESSGPDNARAVLQMLGRSRDRWLLIFDNAEDPELVSQYLPQGKGHVLITSRNPSWGERAQPVPVDVFQRRESVDHLSQRVPRIRREEAAQIAELLADLPVAVAAAGAWLADTGTPVEDYVRNLQSEGASVALEVAADRSIQRTWDLSLERLRERSEAAYRMFQLCCMLAPEIALDLVYSDELAELLKPIDPRLSVRMVRGSLVQQINRLALLRVDQRAEGGLPRDRLRGGQILIHRVVQAVVQSRMTEEERALARLQVQRVLAASRPSGVVDEVETWPRFRTLWPHLDVTESVSSRDSAVRELIIDRVRYQWIQGDLLAGRSRAERTIEVWLQMLPGVTDIDEERELRRQILHLRFNLANILRDMGLVQASHDLDVAVLAEQRELLGGAHPDTLMTQNSLGGDLRGLGQYQEALESDSTTYNLWFENFGEDHPRTLASLSNLAVCNRLMGDFRSARERDELAHQRRRIVLGETNPFTLLSASAIARDVRDAGDYDRAVVLCLAVHKSCVESRGPESRAAMTAQSNLAVSLRSAGSVKDALRLHEEAYERLNDILGPSNPDTLSCRLSLALSHLAMGDPDRARRELEGLMPIYSDVLGVGHPQTLVCETNLAMAEWAALNLEAARGLARTATEGLRGALGHDHPYSLSAQMNLAICEAGLGDLQTALGLLEEAALKMAEVLGDDHPNTLRCQGNIALVAHALGRAGAEERIADVRERLIRRLSSSHPIVEALRKRHYLYRIIDPHPF